MKGRKGTIAAIAFFMLIGLILVVSGWLFFIFLKVHVTSIAVDVDSINRYQEIPTTLLGLTTVEETREGSDFANCFRGNGPAGQHDPNNNLCDKGLAFYHTKFVNGIGDPVLESKIMKVEDGVPDEFSDNLVLSLPFSCFSITLEGTLSQEDSVTDDFSSVFPFPLDGCDFGSLKLDGKYPVPVFYGAEPDVAVQGLKIPSSVSRGEEVLVTWPEFDTCVSDGGTVCSEIDRKEGELN